MAVAPCYCLQWSPTLTDLWWLSHQCTPWGLAVCCFLEWEALILIACWPFSTVLSPVFWRECLIETPESVRVPFPLVDLLELCQLAYLQCWVLWLTRPRFAPSQTASALTDLSCLSLLLFHCHPGLTSSLHFYRERRSRIWWGVQISGVASQLFIYINPCWASHLETSSTRFTMTTIALFSLPAL